MGTVPAADHSFTSHRQRRLIPSVSKLTRFNRTDADDIRAMIDRRFITQQQLIERFNSAVDRFSTDSRAEDIPRYIENLNRVERDMLRVPISHNRPPRLDGSITDRPFWSGT